MDPHGQKTISVSNSPLKVNINPWLEGDKLAKKAQLSPQGSKASTSLPAHAAFTFSCR